MIQENNLFKLEISTRNNDMPSMVPNDHHKALALTPLDSNDSPLTITP